MTAYQVVSGKCLPGTSGSFVTESFGSPAANGFDLVTADHQQRVSNSLSLLGDRNTTEVVDLANGLSVVEISDGEYIPDEDQEYYSNDSLIQKMPAPKKRKRYQTEEARKEALRAQNRASQARFAARRKEKMQALEMETARLSKLISAVKDNNNILEKDIADLKQTLTARLTKQLFDAGVDVRDISCIQDAISNLDQCGVFASNIFNIVGALISSNQGALTKNDAENTGIMDTKDTTEQMLSSKKRIAEYIEKRSVYFSDEGKLKRSFLTEKDCDSLQGNTIEFHTEVNLKCLSAIMNSQRSE